MNLNLGFAQVYILLVVCWRLTMVRTFGYSSGSKQTLQPLTHLCVPDTTKQLTNVIHYHKPIKL